MADLSSEAKTCYEASAKLSSQAKARVNRKFYDAQKQYFLDHNEDKSKSASPSDPIKTRKKLSKWIAAAQVYVQHMNSVLQTDPKSRKEAVAELIKTLKPSKWLSSSLKVDHFLDGSFVQWHSKSSVLTYSENKIGFLTCTVCETEFKWPACERAVKHVCSVSHHKNISKLRKKSKIRPNFAVRDT